MGNAFYSAEPSVHVANNLSTYVSNYDILPSDIKSQQAFCCWRKVREREKIRKPPYDPVSGNLLNIKNEHLHATYEEALKGMEQYGFDGIGIIIKDDLVAIDIDDCIDEQGRFSKTASDIIGQFSTIDTYEEISPSGRGVRILFRAPGFYFDKAKYYINNKENGVEVYIAGATQRYVTITGDCFQEVEVLADGSKELQKMLSKHMNRKQYKCPSSTLSEKFCLSDDELLRKAFSSRKKDEFIPLYRGDISKESSHSEADIALCCQLAFWSGKNKEQMDRLFRQSGLMREKWDELRGDKTYGEITLDKAIELQQKTYNPGYYFGFDNANKLAGGF